MSRSIPVGMKSLVLYKLSSLFLLMFHNNIIQSVIYLSHRLILNNLPRWSSLEKLQTSFLMHDMRTYSPRSVWDVFEVGVVFDSKPDIDVGVFPIISIRKQKYMINLTEYWISMFHSQGCRLLSTPRFSFAWISDVGWGSRLVRLSLTWMKSFKQMSSWSCWGEAQIHVTVAWEAPFSLHRKTEGTWQTSVWSPEVNWRLLLGGRHRTGGVST